MIRILNILFLTATLYFAQTGNFQGNVTEKGNPLPGVNILLMGTNYGAVSNSEGYFKVSKIPVGEYEARFSIVGYKTELIDVSIEQNRTTEINVELEVDVIEVGEVQVFDKKIQQQSDTRVSLIDLAPSEARTLPGAVTDVFRTLQSLPGVLAPNDFSSQLVIRGSGPDQNLIIMDDVEIFNPYRLYGVISMFNPEAVSDISLITGGFPAQYGDRLSAVLDVTNKQGTRTESLAGNLNASIVAANLVLEGKNPFNIPGSWLINSRRTYYDLIIEPFVKNAGLVEDNVTFPNFYDIQAKLTFGPFDGHKFFLNGIYSRDGVDLVSGENRESADSVGVFNITRNDVASFAWHYTPTKNFLNKVIVSWYQNDGGTDFDSEILDPSLNRDNFEDIAPDTLAPYLFGFGFNSNFKFRKWAFDNKSTYLWGEGNELQAGIGYDELTTLLSFEFSIDPELLAFLQSNPNFRSTLEDINDVKTYSRYKAYVNNNFRLAENLFVMPGVRFDYYGILRKGYISPRFSLSYGIDELTTMRAVWGIYYQSPGYEKLLDRGALLNFDREFTDPLQAERSTHYVLSFERWINNKWKAKIEGYYKKFDDLIVARQTTGSAYFTERIPGSDLRNPAAWTRPVANPADSLTQIPVNESRGDAYGVEFFLEKRMAGSDDRLNGWISYALAFADRYEYDTTLPFRFDQRHTLNIVADYIVNDWFSVGLRFQYGSGFPFTSAVGIRPRVILEDNNGDGVPESPVIATRTSSDGQSREVIYDVDFGGVENRFQDRKPDYHRLDVRLNAKADYWGLDWVFYLDVINVYNRSNVIGYDYFVSDDLQLERRPTNMFPILPTLGFNVRF